MFIKYFIGTILSKKSCHKWEIWIKKDEKEGWPYRGGGGGGGGGGQTCSLCFIKHMIDAFQRFLYFSAFKPDLAKYDM